VNRLNQAEHATFCFVGLSLGVLFFSILLYFSGPSGSLIRALLRPAQKREIRING
jgi:hypothetical protein